MSDLAGLEKGRAWEYRVHRAAFLSGWYVRRNVNLKERVAGSPQTMGEVDLLGVAFEPSLTQSSLVAECKDRKGGAREADRVIWLLGLRQALRADHVMFAKPKVSEGAYIWARPHDVWLWDEAAVQAIETAHGVSADIGYGGSFHPRAAFTLPSKEQKSALGGLKAAWDYLSGAFWYERNPARAKKVAGYFEAVLQGTRSAEQRDHLVAEGLLALIACALQTAGHLSRVSPARSKVWLYEVFSAGIAPASALRDIAARADDYYRDAWMRTNRAKDARSPLNVPRLADHVAEPPEWIGEYHQLAIQLGRRPELATDLLRYSELVLFDECLRSDQILENLLSGVGADHGELRRLLQLTAYFVQRAWGVDSDLIRRLSGGSPGAPTREPLQLPLEGSN